MPVWNAFWKVDRVDGVILQSGIVVWLDENEVDDKEERREYIALIQGMDTAYRELVKQCRPSK